MERTIKTLEHFQKQGLRVLLLALSLLSASSTFAYNFKVGGIYYIINGSGVTVTYGSTNYNSYSGNLTIPSTVTYDGVTYPVTSIGEKAFYKCTGLNSITIPESITSIGNDAFNGCTGLTGVNIIDIAAWCRINFAHALGGNYSLQTSNPLYFAHHLYLNGSEIINLVIPNSVTSISVDAFAGCSSLTSVTIPESVTSIGSFAFYGCTGLTKVNINDIAAWCRINFINSINDYYSNYSSNPLCYAHHLYLNGSEVINLVIPESVTSISSFAFYGCIGLNSVTIPESVTSIGKRSFLGCTALETLNYNAVSCADFESQYHPFSGLNISTINIGNSVQCIPAYFASDLNILNSISFPESVTSIGNHAFQRCTGLTSVTIPESVTAIGNYAFLDCTSLETLNYNAISCSCSFYGAQNITTINIGNAVQSISAYFASGLKKLTNINIPESVTSIGEKAFYQCTGLSNITIGNSVTSIGSAAFYGCTGLNSIDIGSSLTSIESSAFEECTRLTRVNITDIAAWCRIGFSSYTSNPLYQAHHIYLNDSELINLVIPNSVTSIGKYTFAGCTGLTSVTFLSSVTSINSNAFAYCSNLLFVKLPKTLKSIGDRSFYYCSGLTSITIPESVTTIGNYAFSGCTDLFSVTIPNSVTSIGNYAFSGCTGLTSVAIKSYLTSIGEYAFSNCSALSSFTCMSETPPIFDNSNSFNTYSTTSLYVPRSGVENYKTHTNWRRFSKIYEFVGYFTVPDVNVSKGKTVVVPVSMTNEEDIIGFQTDIYLPEGFEFVKEGNDYVVDPSDRMARDHAIMCNVSEDGALRVLCYSPTNKVISGNEGELFYVTIKAPNDTVGDFSIWFKNTILTTSDAEELLSPDASTNLNVIPYLPGDVNGNGEVSVIDIVTAAQYIIFQDPDPFFFEAADLNNDEQITVTDLALIANLILYPTMNAPKRVPSIDLSKDQIHGNDILLNAGETQTVNITLDNAENYSAFQMDLKLPDGLSASNFKMTNQSDSHSFITSEEKDGIIRVLCYSPSLTALGNANKSLLTFDVTSTGNIVGDIIIDGIELVTTSCQPVHLDALAIGVNQTNTVNEVSCGKSVAQIDYYNLAGQKQAEPAKGVTIIVTTYSDGSRSTQKVIM